MLLIVGTLASGPLGLEDCDFRRATVSQPGPRSCYQEPPGWLLDPNPQARLLSGGQLHQVPASVGMGLPNILEGPHSFVSQLQKWGWGDGGAEETGEREAVLLPTSSPPRPSEPCTLWVQRWRVDMMAAPEGGRDLFSLSLSSGYRSSSGITRSEGWICPGLFFPNQNTPLQRTLFFQLAVFLRAHRAATVTFWPERPGERQLQAGATSITIL